MTKGAVAAGADDWDLWKLCCLKIFCIFLLLFEILKEKGNIFYLFWFCFFFKVFNIFKLNTL